MCNDVVAKLEARLTAQRRVLMWLISRLGKVEAACLLNALWEPFPPQDGQEDPGAVPVDAFALTAAYGEEMRTILRPLADTPAPAPSGRER